MAIVLFAVITVFGVLAMYLWAALSSARLKLARSKQLTDALFQVLERDAALSPAERAALAMQRAAIYEEG